MGPRARVARKVILIIPLGMGMGASVSDVSAQTTSVPKALPVSDSTAAQDKPDKPDMQKRMRSNQPLPKSWLNPVADERPYAFLRADVLEYRPKGNESDFRWDMDGWYGGDYNRLWVKSEGERNTAFKADYDIDFQMLYGRFIKKYYDFQVGVRGETQTFRGGEVARAHAVIGFQGLVPYRYEIESALFISQDGDVSARFQTSRDFLLTQRLILQARFETHAAVQRVERFTTGSGLNNIEFGLRLRYEIKRQIAPYVGVSIDHSFFDTAKLVRQEGGNPSQVRFVAGARLWF